MQQASLLYVVDNTAANWSSGAVFQYITSLTQNAAVKPGTVFISRPLVPAAVDDKSSLFTNGTALTVATDAEPEIIEAGEDVLQVVEHFAYFIFKS